MKPMRLVDIGNLTIKIQYPRCNGKTVAIDAIEKALNELPTVDAIPVEFIKSEIKENKGFYNSNLRRLLDVWEERKEE